MSGKVWLVGAGPGDRGLFTLKGLEVLQDADVVVHDALIGSEVLTLIPEKAVKIDVGKRASKHRKPQERINQILLEQAQAGQKVVRLKGGDPFLFGRGGEELELLVKNDIPYEIVPGVTSAFAVPAYNGIPVTHRDYASSVHVITGHRRADRGAGPAGTEKIGKPVESGSAEILGKSGEKLPEGTEKTGKPVESESAERLGKTEEALPAGTEKAGYSGGRSLDIDFEALARMGGTLVFLMGLSNLPVIMAGLMAAGMDPETPAAVLEKGTLAAQRRVVATIATLEEKSQKALIQAPAIIVVGKVCSLSEEFAWAEKRPLAGKKILLTRPKELISEMAARLRRLGAEVLELPAIDTVPINPNPELEKCLERFFDNTVQTRAGESNGVRRQEGLDYVRPLDWLVFTSPTGVRVFMDGFLEKHDVRALYGTRIAAIGAGSSRKLRQYGIRPDFVPSVFDGQTLGRELAEKIVRELEEKNTGESPEKRSGESSEKLTGVPTKEGSGEPTKKCTGESPEKRSGELLEKLTEEPTKKCIGESPEKSSGESSEKLTGMPTKEGSGEPTKKCIGESLEKRTGESSEKLTGEQVYSGFSPVRIMIPRAAIGNHELIEELKKIGNVEILDIPTYNTEYTFSGIIDLKGLLSEGEIDYAVFTSASTVRGFSAQTEGMDLSGLKAVCIGRQTRAAAEALGMECCMAEKATLDALEEAVVDCAAKSKE